MKKSFKKALFQKRKLVYDYKDFDGELATEEQVAGIVKSFNSIGIAFDRESVKFLLSKPIENVKKFYKNAFELGRMGRDLKVKKVVTFYPNFPEMEDISEIEYYVRAMLHYINVTESDQTLYVTSDLPKANRSGKVHDDEKIMVSIVTEEQVDKIIPEMAKEIFEQKIAISFDDDTYRFLVDAVKKYGKMTYPDEIPFKENIVKFLDVVSDVKQKDINNYEVNLDEDVLKFVKTPTDLLRVYALISNDNAMLKYNVEFKSLKRSTRKMFIKMLDEMAKNKWIYDDLARHEFMFKKMFEYLHVGEYKKFNNIHEVAKNFRSGNYQTFYSKLESLLNDQDKYLEFIKTRPGEFLRKLDHLLRMEEFDSTKTLDAFEEICDKASTSVLLQLWSHFKNRNLGSTRIFRIKGVIDTFTEVEETRAEISQEIIDKTLTTIEKGLIIKYSDYDKLQKVYIDENMKNFSVPTSQRNATISTMGKMCEGSRIKLDTEKYSYMRVFTHWKNIQEKNKDIRVDIDLSAELVNEELTMMKSLAWHNMYAGHNIKSYHSGDLTTAPKGNGANEFIDIDINSAKDIYRYVMISNCVYTQQQFYDIPNCFSGVMFLPALEEGPLFNAESVKLKFFMQQKDVTHNIPFMIDLKTMELIWLDIPLQGRVAACSDSILMSLRDALKTKMNLYDFFKLHSGHIEFVDNKEDAEIIIGDVEGATITPYDVEKISKFM